MSVREAPGQIAWTIITRKVKSGSSFWPIRTRPSTPAMTMTAIRKRVTLGFSIAQRERLKPRGSLVLPSIIGQLPSLRTSRNGWLFRCFAQRQVVGREQHALARGHELGACGDDEVSGLQPLD